MKPDLRDSSHSLRACIIFEKLMDISFCKEPLNFEAAHTRWFVLSLSLLKSGEDDGNHILTSTPVTLTTLKLLSHAVSFCSVTLAVLPAFSFQECVPLIIVEVPLCYSTLVSKLNLILFPAVEIYKK